MDRRLFLTSAAAFSLAPVGARARMIDYTPGKIEAALGAGETVLVDYAADWCSTCKRQERVIRALRDANPAYDTAITFIRVDWDEYQRHAVTRSRGVPRRSTLLLLRGDEELGRLVAETREASIKALLDLAL